MSIYTIKIIFQIISQIYVFNFGANQQLYIDYATAIQ